MSNDQILFFQVFLFCKNNNFNRGVDQIIFIANRVIFLNFLKKTMENHNAVKSLYHIIVIKLSF